MMRGGIIYILATENPRFYQLQLLTLFLLLSPPKELRMEEVGEQVGAMYLSTHT